jgi:hypothetical protein
MSANRPLALDFEASDQSRRRFPQRDVIPKALAIRPAS